jgi:hypothetical protein
MSYTFDRETLDVDAALHFDETLGITQLRFAQRTDCAVGESNPHRAQARVGWR